MRWVLVMLSAIQQSFLYIYAGRVGKSMIKMHMSAADEWAIHKEASDVIFSRTDGSLGVIQYYNKLNNHERVVEYAESLAAELCVARYFGLDFDISDSKGKARADVGKGIEVKWTSYVGGNLIVYPADRDSDVAVLVVGKSPEYFIVGWLPVIFAKRKRFKNPRQDTWWVDQANLNPIENLSRSEYAATAI